MVASINIGKFFYLYSYKTRQTYGRVYYGKKFFYINLINYINNLIKIVYQKKYKTSQMYLFHSSSETLEELDDETYDEEKLARTSDENRK